MKFQYTKYGIFDPWLFKSFNIYGENKVCNWKQATYLEGNTKKTVSPSTVWLKMDKHSSTYTNPSKIE